MEKPKNLISLTFWEAYFINRVPNHQMKHYHQPFELMRCMGWFGVRDKKTSLLFLFCIKSVTQPVTLLELHATHLKHEANSLKLSLPEPLNNYSSSPSSAGILPLSCMKSRGDWWCVSVTGIRWNALWQLCSATAAQQMSVARQHVYRQDWERGVTALRVNVSVTHLWIWVTDVHDVRCMNGMLEYPTCHQRIPAEVR